MRAVSALGLVIFLSVVFNLTFMATVDISLFTILTVDDYVSSLVVWMVPAGLFFAFGLAIRYLLDRQRTESTAQRKTKVFWIIPWLRWQKLKILFGIGVILLGPFFDYPPVEGTAYWFLNALALGIAIHGAKELLLSDEAVWNSLNFVQVALIEIYPILVLVTAFGGHLYANQLMNSDEFNYRLHLVGGNAVDHAPIRHTSQGTILIPEFGSEVLFVPWGRIESLEVIERHKIDRATRGEE